MKKFLNITVLVASVLLLASVTGACSEDDIKVDPEMGFTLEDPEPGAEGTLQAEIYHFYNDYGTYVLHDFPETYLRFQWTITWRNEYTPVQDGFEPYALRMLDFIEGGLLGTYPENTLVNLPYRIFLVEELKTLAGVTNVLEVRGNDYIVGNVGPAFDSMSEDDLNTLRTTIFQEFTARLYQSSTTPPTDFFNLRILYEEGVEFLPYLPEGSAIEDPLREISDNPFPGYWDYRIRYTYMYGGFIQPVWRIVGMWSMYESPTFAKDFADYVSFMLTSTATYLDRIMTREDMYRIQARVLALVPYLQEVLDIDPIAVQNKNQPGDPLPAGYYDRF